MRMMQISCSAALVMTALVLRAGVVASPAEPGEFRHPSLLSKSEDGALQSARAAWVIGGEGSTFKVDPAKRYKISVDMRLAPGEKAGDSRIGFCPQDANGYILSPENVFFTPGSETELVKDVAKGDTTVTVKDLSKWRNRSAVVCFDADPTGKERDIPNMNYLGRIKSIDRATGVITLATPARADVSAGTAVREHHSSWSFVGSIKCPLTENWQTFQFTTRAGTAKSVRQQPNLKFWVHTESAVPIIATGGKIQFRNLKVEELEQ